MVKTKTSRKKNIKKQIKNYSEAHKAGETRKNSENRKNSATRINRKLPKVAVIMGSANDMRIMQDAVAVLTEFKIPHVAKVVSAHRTPEFMYEFAHSAESNQIQVIIAGAGGAAHLPGMVASLTHLPVIGVPIVVGKLEGLDSLLSIAQMPKGIPVATVATDNAYNAGLLAARIMSLTSPSLTEALKKYSIKLKKKILRAKI